MRNVTRLLKHDYPYIDPKVSAAVDPNVRYQVRRYVHSPIQKISLVLELLDELEKKLENE